MIEVGAARRRDTGADYPLPPASEVAPYAATQLVAIPTYDGSGQTIHPSVLDMGAKWHGYRWWLADTPYAGQAEALENPSVFASNDRINWVVPAGLANPLDDAWDPGPPMEYNSDTELIYDPVSARMICFWRYVPGNEQGVLRAKTSTDGSTWSATIDVGPVALSPSITRKPDGRWLRFEFLPGAWLEADDPLGPWTVVPGRPGPGTGVSGSPHHGAVKWVGDRYVAIYTASGHPTLGKVMCLAQSMDLTAWSEQVYLPGTGGVLTNPYRPTLLASTKPGWIDVWHSAMDGGQWVAYTRVPLSALNPV